MTTKIIYKDTFSVIGKAGQGTAGNPGEWIAPLWQAANANFAEISGIIRRNESGAPLVWGAMNDADEQNKRWGDIGKYMAGCEADTDAMPPIGWTKWIIPAQTYLVADCTGDQYGEVFGKITSDPDVHIIATNPLPESRWPRHWEKNKEYREHLKKCSRRQLVA
jgi:predicted transcriptional regulator YdeE